VLLGFAAIYLIWGSTYLGIRYAVETIPPLLMMAIRHTTAGVLVYAWARRKAQYAPSWREWMYAIAAGALLFLLGHGLLAWAEVKIPSGLAALLCATLPLWTVLAAGITRSEKRLGARAWIGLLLGFAGVAVLIGPDAFRHTGHLDLWAAAGAMGSALAWAIGTVFSKRVRMNPSPVLSAAMQMIAGGVWLALASVAGGEATRVHLADVSLRSVLATAYLIVFGSIIAFTVFTWLLTVATPSQVSTYAYVNPVVAVLIGWAIGGESVGSNTLIAAIVIVSAVALVTRGKKAEAVKAAPDVEVCAVAAD
jgi:drug/metabolite transporter (DMT)-like permease